MDQEFDRRSVIASLAASGAMGFLGSVGWSQVAHAAGLSMGPAQPFSFEQLKLTARQLAQDSYHPAPLPAPEIVTKLDYENWGKITFDAEHALFAEGPGRFPITFFHLGKFFPKTIEMYAIENRAGTEVARQILYDSNMFKMPYDSLARKLPPSSGFAGFKIQEPRDGQLDWRKNDWAAFLGASYFRAIGELYQYGLSARGIALDVAAINKLEEFPDFTKFYIAGGNGDSITLYALLEGPSIVGAYKFLLTRGKNVVMDIENALFLRGNISRFGIAPCTSMYWFSETKKTTAIDWRPEIHDSDGLALWTGGGERLWRPLNNPPRTMASAFLDDNPRGYGLLQRDRLFDHYLDGVFYDRRPSLWVEPIGSWGRGAIHLVEIPTDDEIHDNIVAMWVPEKQALAGTEWAFRYKLYWGADEPFPSPLGRVTGTRLGNGGQPGLPRPLGVRKFMVEFSGGPLVNIPFGTEPEAVVTLSRGELGKYRGTEAVPDGVPGHWRTQFDVIAEGPDPVEIRCFLKFNTTILTETWSCQYHPF